MLKNIPEIISPSLLKYLAEMGHSDTLVIADGNFPIHSVGKDAHVVHLDGNGVVEVLEAILKLLPLDTYVDKPVSLMQKVAGDQVEVPIWDEIEDTVAQYDERGAEAIQHIDRFDFYEQAKSAYVLIATSERQLYANVILQKGVV